MKRKHLSNEVLVCGSIPLEQRRAKLAEMLANGAPPAAATVLVGKIPDAEEPPPLPSLYDLVKMKFGLGVEHNAPEWAKCAAEMAFDSLAPKRRKRKASDAYNLGFDSGHFYAAEELISPDAGELPAKQIPQEERAIHNFDVMLKRQWAEQPPDKAADFFCGYRDGEKLMRGVPERAKQMAQRTKIYRAIAARWKEIAPGVLGSTSDLYQWLLDQNIILPRTDSAEIRLVCKKIGLRYKKPGKPPKQKM